MRRMLCASAVLAPVIAVSWMMNLTGGGDRRAGNPSAAVVIDAETDEGRTRALPEQAIDAMPESPSEQALGIAEFRAMMPALSESLLPSRRGLRQPMSHGIVE